MPMSSDALKKLISAQLLTCITSSFDVKMEYTGTLLSNIEKWITTEKIDKDPNRGYLIHVYNDLYLLAQALVMEASREKLSNAEINTIQKKIGTTHIILDTSWDKESAKIGVETIRQLGEVRLARHNFSVAQDHFAYSLQGRAESYSAAIRLVDDCLKTVLDLSIECDLVQFGEKEWLKRVSPQAAKAEVK